MKTKLSPLSLGHTPGHPLLIRGINSPCLPFSLREEKFRKAFTLVELIVVITILAILGTIAFISIQSYTVYARDSVRLSNLRTIESSLKIQYTQGGAYAVPDDSVNITASGTVIRKQGVFGKQALRTVKLNSDASEDPLTGESYDYIVDNNLSEYQLVGYMEGDEAYHNTLQAETFANNGSTLKTLGQDLGIVFSGGVAVHRESANVGNNIDIMNATGNLNIVFDEGDETGYLTGSQLFSRVYNRSKALLKNKELAKLDESLYLWMDFDNIDTGLIRNYASGGIEGDLNNNAVQDYEFYRDTDYLTVFKEKSAGAFVIGETTRKDVFSLTISFNPDKEISTHTFNIIAGSSFGNNLAAGIRYDSLLDMISYQDYPNHGDVRYALTEEGSIKKNQWNHVVLIYDMGNVSIYINGKLSSTESGIHMNIKTNDNNLNDRIIIGRALSHYADNYREFDGGIDDFRLYSRALSKEEVQVIYGSTLK